MIEIISTANMAGVAEAKAGMLGFNAITAGATIALGALYVAGKSAVEISREHFQAENALANAIKNRGANSTTVEKSLRNFMQTNRDFIGNQNDVIAAYAALVREGVKARNLSREMTTALNIQAVEGGTLQEAVEKLQSAEVGRNRGLQKAVGLVLQAIPAHATYAEKLKIIEHNMQAVSKAYRDGTKAVDPLTVATNHLKQDWEKIAEKYGPELVTQISAVAKEIDKNMPTWEHWLTVVGDVISQVHAALDPTAANKVGLQQGHDLRDWIWKNIMDPIGSRHQKSYSVPAAQTTAQLLQSGMTPAQYAAYYAKHIGTSTGPGSTGLTPAEYKAQWKFEQDHMNKTIAMQDRTNNLLGQIVRKTPTVQIYSQPGTQVSAARIIRKITAI